MNSRKSAALAFWGIQSVVIAAFATAWAGMSAPERQRFETEITGAPPAMTVPVSRTQPLRITPFYDDSEVVSDEELAAVLQKILPRFTPEHLRPNFIEHALRAWGVDATFRDPEVMSGVEMRDVLTDHGRFLQSWKDRESITPLLLDRPHGIAVRWGQYPEASVHHDHWLASLTEAGVSLDQPVYGPARRDMTINDVLQESLRDFRLDEKEVEWSAMAFGLWLAPVSEWTTGDGRQMSMDQLARRLIRGHQRYGVCAGTHRVYSLMLLIRLDDEHGILSPLVRAEVWQHLEHVRDMITVSQFEDGHWPTNWSDGEAAVLEPVDDPEYRKVIATGHHLEWLAIAPRELHPPRELILKAADWIIDNTRQTPVEDIQAKYTFYSHVGNALALWRKTRPADFWKQWEATHPAAAAKK